MGLSLWSLRVGPARWGLLNSKRSTVAAGIVERQDPSLDSSPKHLHPPCERLEVGKEMPAEVSSASPRSPSSTNPSRAAEDKTNPHCGLAATQPRGDVPAKFALHCFSPGHDDLFSCCQSKNFRGASFTYFAVHITGALVLFMTDGIVVSSANRGILPERSSIAFFFPNHW